METKVTYEVDDELYEPTVTETLMAVAYELSRIADVLERVEEVEAVTELKAENARLREAAAGVVVGDPPTEDVDMGDSSWGDRCALCKGWGNYNDDKEWYYRHEPDCPWVKLIAALEDNNAE